MHTHTNISLSLYQNRWQTFSKATTLFGFGSISAGQHMDELQFHDMQSLPVTNAADYIHRRQGLLKQSQKEWLSGNLAGTSSQIEPNGLLPCPSRISLPIGSWWVWVLVLFGHPHNDHRSHAPQSCRNCSACTLMCVPCKWAMGQGRKSNGCDVVENGLFIPSLWLILPEDIVYIYTYPSAISSPILSNIWMLSQ